MNHTITTEQIIKLKSFSVVYDVRKYLKELFPDQHTKPGWYVANLGSRSIYMCYFENPQISLLSNLHFLPSGEMIEDMKWFYKIERKATSIEVGPLLISAAKKKGFIKGATVGNTVNSSTGIIDFEPNFMYENGELDLQRCVSFNEHYTIFSNGKWAEVHKETKEQKAVKFLQDKGYYIIDPDNYGY